MKMFYIIIETRVSEHNTQALKIPVSTLPLNKIYPAILHLKKLTKCTIHLARYIVLCPYASLILTPWLQVEKLLFSQAGRLAQRRLAHGKKLNHLECTVSRDMSRLTIN